MSAEDKKTPPVEFRTNGVLVEKGIRITEQSSIDALTNRGYGTVENKIFTLAFYEALYLQDKGMLEVKEAGGKKVDFQNLLHEYSAVNENAWVNYLIYRDLRGRGYVVREGFGVGTEFRIYERGSYGKENAAYLVVGTQEGKPLPIQDLTNALQQVQSQKKELVIAVMNRRGEIVYYAVSQLNIKQPIEEKDDD
jgi:tRNA-intron endonuclease, archaea type